MIEKLCEEVDVSRILSMTNDERKKISSTDKSNFHRLQTEKVVNRIADSVARSINSEAKKMDVKTFDADGKLESHPYKAQMILEHVIERLEEMV